MGSALEIRNKYRINSERGYPNSKLFDRKSYRGYFIAIFISIMHAEIV